MDTATAPLLYGGQLAVAIRRLKLGGSPHLARPLATLLRPTLSAIGASLSHPVHALVPVPLHPRRLRQRGYNQAALLARELCGLSGVPVRYRLLRRVRDTPTQTGLDAASRRHNMHGAFAASPHAAGQRLILLDDVGTTLATADACATALRQAGALEVHLLTLARAMP